MFAELLTVERSGAIDELLASCPSKPHSETVRLGNSATTTSGNAKRQTETWSDQLLELLISDISRAVESGGIARVYCANKRVAGLCVTELDESVPQELGQKVTRISHLMALGRPEVQIIIKQLLLRETLRSTSGVLVTCVPYFDLTSINALESCGFTTSRTSVVLARELEECIPDVTPASHYDVDAAAPSDVDGFDDTAFDIPSGFLGWDAELPRALTNRVHRDWLRTYARQRRLLVARDQDRPVGLLAEDVKYDTEAALGFRIGSIDLVKTVARYRENGVAAALIGRSLAAFRSEGVRLAELTVDSTDTPVINSCLAQGFVAVSSSITLVNRKSKYH
ncbi:MAG: hypothetical protein ABIK86_00555 [candidate division WOR-3 bacterium]